MRQALDAGMNALRAVCRVNERNLPMRLLFRQMGFETLHSNDVLLLSRDLSKPLPDYPEWLRLHEG